MNVPQMEAAELGQAKLLRMLDKPRTIEYLIAQSGRDRTTVYRWLREVQRKGATIVRLGSGRPVQYQRMR